MQRKTTMKTIKKTATFITLIMVLSGIGVLIAPASLSAVILFHGWEYGVGNFDEMYATSTNPVFASPGFCDFTTETYDPVVDWAGAFTSAYAIGASGPTIQSLVFAFNFDETAAATPFSVEYYSYGSGVMRDWATLYYNGEGLVDHDYSNWTIETHQLPTIPEPTTFLLLGGGLLGLAGFVRRSKH
jgi:hypothetical protein